MAPTSTMPTLPKTRLGHPRSNSAQPMPPPPTPVPVRKSVTNFPTKSHARGRNRGFGAAAIILAASVWGTNGLATAFLPPGTSAATIATARLLVGGALLLALCHPKRLRTSLTHRAHLAPLAVATTSMATYQGCYFAALDQAGVATGSVVTMGSVPVFTGIITWCTGHGRPSAKWLTATAFAIAGGTILALARPAGDPALTGVCCALLAGAGYALFTTSSTTAINQGADCRATMAIIFVTAGVLTSPFLAIYPAGWLGSSRGIAVVAYLAGVSTVMAYLLYGHGLQTVPTTTASTLTLAEPGCATITAILVLHEPVTTAATTGLSLLAVALLALTIPAGTIARFNPLRHQRLPPQNTPTPNLAGYRSPGAEQAGDALLAQRLPHPSTIDRSSL